MNEAQQRRRPTEAPAEEHIEVSLKGSPAVVARMLASLAGSLESPATVEPEPLYVTREEAARRTGIHRDRLSSLVTLGHITNYGTPAKLRLSLAEIRAWQEEQR